MKISLEELKRAVDLIEANFRDIQVEIYTSEGNKLGPKCMDRYDTRLRSPFSKANPCYQD